MDWEQDENLGAESDFRPLGRPIEPEAEGLRVDDHCSREFKFLSRNQWQNRIDRGELLVNQKDVKASYRLRLGDQLQYYFPLEAEPEVSTDIRMIWRQGGVMAVFKPGNLPMHENGRHRTRTFARLVADTFGPEWSAVHRLDKETSGVVICAATHDLRSKLSALLRGRDVFKRYLAIVMGHPSDFDWVENGPIGDLQESAIRIKKWVVPDGLPALTRFRWLEQGRGYSLVEAFPKTGRTNQIRIHLAHGGLPIVGDKMYHPDENVFLTYWREGNTPDVHRLAGFHRHCLHAAEIAFVHPELGAKVWVECPMAPDMVDLWKGRHPYPVGSGALGIAANPPIVQVRG